MIYITLSVIQSVLILVTFKLFERFKIDNLQAIVVNYIVAGSFGYSIASTEWTPGGLVSFDWFPIALFLGGLFICTFFLFALSSQKVGVAVTSVTSKMSLVIPVIASIFLFGEKLTWLRVAGIVIALAAFYLTFRQKDKATVKLKYVWVPFLVFTGNGIVDTTMKYADHHYIKDDLILFLAVVFSTSFIIGSSVLVIRTIKSSIRISWKNIAAGAFLGLINFGSTFYMLKAISVFESSVVFPVTNAAIVGLSGLVGYFGFREKLGWQNWAGIIMALLAILIIAKA
jgi:drug/metabolite transporter (DMT)-like permease